MNRRERLMAEILPKQVEKPIEPDLDFKWGEINGMDILRDLGDMAAAAGQRGHVATAEVLVAAIAWLQKLNGLGGFGKK